MFRKKFNNGYSLLNVHVDDVLAAFNCQQAKDEFNSILSRVYRDYKCNSLINGPIGYLGMEIRKEVNGDILVSQKQYIKETLSIYNVKAMATSPATSTLCELHKEDDDNKPYDMTAYASLVMKLMFIAKRSRPDLLLTLSVLCTKCKSPTENDYKRLIRVLAYLNNTKDIPMRYICKTNSELTISADASHLVHGDSRGHTGIVVQLGCNTVYCKSSKQKIVCRSSTESELVAQEESAVDALWFKELIEFLTGTTIRKPIKIYQDNQSSIKISTFGSKANKHIRRRFDFIHQHIESKSIQLTYRSSKELIADQLTKPLQGKVFITSRDALLNYHEVNGNSNGLGATTKPLKGCVVQSTSARLD